MKPSIFNRIALPAALLAVGALCPDVHADWGSLQGNNRSAPAQSAPRQQPPVNRAPQPAFRPAPQPQQPAFHQQPQPEIRSEPPPAFHPQPQPQIRTAEPPRQEVQPAPRVQPQIGAPYRQPAVAVDRGREQPQRIDNARASETDRRRMDIDGERRQSFFWSDYHAGMRIDRLPDGYRRFHFRDHDYYYFEGVFYDDEPSGYVVIAPPLDADVPDLPPGAETVVANGTVYYYVDGTFYVQESDGSYVVVAAPIGVTVSELPPDAVQVVINGVAYYQSGGIYYLPVMENGVTAYLTVAQP